MKLEVIATTPQEALDAQAYGATRIELISAPLEGGLTPSYALIKKVKSLINIPVHVMIRPHAKSFIYDAYEKEIMIEDIKMIAKLKVDAFVFGALTPDGKIDEPLLKQVVEAANGIPITFHKAIDMANDIELALSILSKYPTVKLILTSYGNTPILENAQAIKRISETMNQTNQTILAGGGLNLENIENFIKVSQVKQVHFGTGVRFNNHFYGEIDHLKMKKLIEILNREHL